MILGVGCVERGEERGEETEKESDARATGDQKLVERDSGLEVGKKEWMKSLFFFVSFQEESL